MPTIDYGLLREWANGYKEAEGHDQHRRALVCSLLAENERLRTQLDGAQLRAIEATNPGIDMDEVRRFRAGEEVRSENG